MKSDSERTGDRLLRCSAWLDRISEPLVVMQQQLVGWEAGLCAGWVMVLNGGCKRVKLVFIYLAVLLPYLLQASEGAFADKRLNSVNGGAHLAEAGRVKGVPLLPHAYNLGLQLGDARQIPVNAVPPPPPPSEEQSGAGGDNASKNRSQQWACSVGVQVLLFSVGYFLGTAGCLWLWDWSVRARMRSNDPSSPTAGGGSGGAQRKEPK
jgi:hypothetical protein